MSAGRRALPRLVAAVVVVLLLASGTATAERPPGPMACQPGAPSADAPARPGAALLALPPGEPTVAVAVHDGASTVEAVAAFEALGLVAQPLAHLPMTLLFGPASRLARAAQVAGVTEVHPDRRLEAQSRTSTRAIGADRVWEDLGFTGEGVGIAIVDSGLDATHPAFQGRVVRNVKLVGPEYLAAFGVPVGDEVPPGTIVVPVDEGPYSNTDLNGHGTHVAGVVAAGDVGGDEQDSPVGVAPGAHLLAYAIGEVSVVTALAAFDDILEHREQHDIRVVNNSWGDRFSAFDPGDPINVATKALHDAGIVVTFAAGNEADEMTLNAFAAAPWVISVGSATLSGASSATSSGGIRYDSAGVPESRSHARFEGDGLGLYHPHLSAPGERILSAATPTGPTVGYRPHLPGGTATASGTSQASPHAAGLAALVVEAAPQLSPGEVKQVLQATASPAPGDALWKSGFGFLDAGAAVELVTSPGFSTTGLRAIHEARAAELLARRDRRVVATDVWGFDAAGPAAAMGTDARCLAFTVDRETEALRAVASFAGTHEPTSNSFEWSLTVRDAAGAFVGRSQPLRRNGISLLEVDLAAVEGGVVHGTWTVEVAAELAVTAPQWQYTPAVSVVATQLAARDTQPLPVERTALALSTAGTADLPASSPEGCQYRQPPEAGRLGATAPASCRAALIGVVWTDVAGMAEFVSSPVEHPMQLEGTAGLVLHLADEGAASSGPLGYRVSFVLELLTPGAPPVVLASERAEAEVAPAPARGEYPFVLAPTAVPAGSRLRLRLEALGVQSSSLRLLYGGGYDSGLLLPT